MTEFIVNLFRIIVITYCLTSHGKKNETKLDGCLIISEYYTFNVGVR